MSKYLVAAGEKIRYWLSYALDRYVGITMCFLLFPFSKILPQKAPSYERILVIKLSMMGDTILLIPALRALRKRFKDARISILCSSINRVILQDCPYIDEIIMLEFGQLINPLYLLRLFYTIINLKFDMVLDFEQWYKTSALISFLSFAKVRIGFKTRGQLRHHLFTRAVVHLKLRHEVECLLDILGPLNIEAEDKRLELWPQQTHRQQAENLLASLKMDSDFIVMQAEVSITGRQRQWPIKNFAEAGNRLIEKYNLKIIVTSTSRGKEEAEELNALLGRRAHMLMDIPLLTLSVILSKAKFVITNNTGIMHVAVASGAKVVVPQGPISTKKWGPWGEGHAVIESHRSCSPCVYLGNFEYDCGKNSCMQEITVDEVLRSIEEKHMVGGSSSISI